MKFVYLHGFASGPQSSKAQYFLQRFKERGIPLDIPELVDGDFSELTITGQLGVIERAIQGAEVSLIGSSMGGYLAALYASRHPEVAKLVLLAPAFQFVQRWPEELGDEKTQEWQTTGRLEVFHYGERRARYIGWQLIEDGRRYPAEPHFSQPALIFHGVNDDVVPPSFSESFTEKHPNVRLTILPSDHQLTDVTAQIWRESEAFLLDGA